MVTGLSHLHRWQSQFPISDPIGDPLSVELDREANSDMRNPALPCPLLDGLGMEGQEITHLSNCQQTGLALQFFG
jgi:hypothetical protein